MEIWKKLNDWEKYEISNYGNVRSLDYNHTGKTKILAFGKRRGYRGITVMTDGIKTTISPHREVYKHFIGQIPEGMEINHKDGDKHNNYVGNLELMTSKENIQHSIHELKVRGPRKIIIKCDDDGNEICRYDGIKEAMEDNGLSKDQITVSIHRGTRGGGYKWKSTKKEL